MEDVLQTYLRPYPVVCLDEACKQLFGEVRPSLPVRPGSPAKQDDEHALEDLLASFLRRPEAAASLDGLNISPVDTAKMLKARLSQTKREDLLGRLQTALDKLDPELLLLPQYERELPGANPTNRRGTRRPPGQTDR